jgi:SNF2 family DNA or RNA helicase
LILCQLWSEHKRKILLIVPAALRKQWANELQEKFFLPSQILDGPIYKQIKLLDAGNPFDQQSIIICSYHFAAKHIEDVESIKRDVAVLDEAHKLRNVYKDLEKEAKRYQENQK